MNIKKNGYKEKCPFCGEFFATNAIERHIKSCYSLDKFQSFSEFQLRDFLRKRIIHVHPKCPVCKHRNFAAITKMVLDGEPYNYIVEKYGSRKGQPKFYAKHLTQHKQHLHLDQAVVLELSERSIKNNRPLYYKETAPITKSKKVMDALEKSLIIKGKKLSELTLIQVSKLNVAKRIYEELLTLEESLNTMLAKKIEKYVYKSECTDSTKTTGTTEVKSDGDYLYEKGFETFFTYTSDELKAKQRLFLSYMDSIGDLQNKILKYYEDLNTPPTVNYGLLQTILSSGELTIIKILTDEIDDPILRVRVTREVAKTINSINSEVSNLYSQEVEGYSNPVNVIYDEVLDDSVDLVREEK